MDYESDELSITPIYAVKGVQKTIYLLTEAGRLYAIDPSTGAVPEGWPVGLSETFDKHDLAIDARGAIVLVTDDGDIKAVWGR